MLRVRSAIVPVRRRWLGNPATETWLANMPLGPRAGSGSSIVTLAAPIRHREARKDRDGCDRRTSNPTAGRRSPRPASCRRGARPAPRPVRPAVPRHRRLRGGGRGADLRAGGGQLPDRMWLSDRIAAAQVAALVLDAADGRAGLGRPGRAACSRASAPGPSRSAAAAPSGCSPIEPMPETVADTVDLREVIGPVGDPRRVARPSWLRSRDRSAWSAQGGDGFDRVEILLDEAPLRTAMIDFALRLLVSSLIIAAVGGGPRLRRAAGAHRAPGPAARHATSRPSRTIRRDAGRIIAPSRRSDEIGQAETRARRGCSAPRRSSSAQKRRLAELGPVGEQDQPRAAQPAHRARSSSATAWRAPPIRRCSAWRPRLVATLDRAIRFCEATLAYGRATERDAASAPASPLAPIFAELPDLAALAAQPGGRARSRPADLGVQADPEQFAPGARQPRPQRRAGPGPRAAGGATAAVTGHGRPRRAGPGDHPGRRQRPRPAGARPGEPVRAVPGLDALRRHRARPAIAAELIGLNGGTPQPRRPGDRGTASGSCCRTAEAPARTGAEGGGGERLLGRRQHRLGDRDADVAQERGVANRSRCWPW